MSTHATSVRGAAVALTAATLLSLSMIPVALAGQRADAARTATLHPKHKQWHVARKRPSWSTPNISASVPHPSGCPWPYRNQWPPCQSSYPEGDPNYSGSTGAP